MLFNCKLFIFAPAIYGEIAQLVLTFSEAEIRMLTEASALERPDHRSGRSGHNAKREFGEIAQLVLTFSEAEVRMLTEASALERPDHRSGRSGHDAKREFGEIAQLVRAHDS